MTPDKRKEYYTLVAKHNGEPKEVSPYASALLGCLHEIESLESDVIAIQEENAELATALAAHENK